jgi:hypothetical protein
MSDLTLPKQELTCPLWTTFMRYIRQTAQYSTVFFPIRYFVNCPTWYDASALPGSDWLQPDIEAGLMCDDVSAACISHMQTTFQERNRLAWPGRCRSGIHKLFDIFVFP